MIYIRPAREYVVFMGSLISFIYIREISKINSTPITFFLFYLKTCVFIRKSHKKTHLVNYGNYSKQIVEKIKKILTNLRYVYTVHTIEN